MLTDEAVLDGGVQPLWLGLGDSIAEGVEPGKVGESGKSANCGEMGQTPDLSS